MKWAAKIAAKLLLSQFPVPYRLWQRIGLFRHGRMDSSAYSISIFDLHTRRAFPDGLPSGMCVLELGPGDSIASAIIAASRGTSKVYLVDAGRYAIETPSHYRELAQVLKQMGLEPPNLSQARTLEDILAACNAEYLTDGVASIESIPDRSIDFAWSHSVLEHVRKHELVPLLRELRRIMRPESYASHNIDYQDHLDHSLHNLRFPESLWESEVFANAGFYTNRIPALEMHALFKQVGFEICQEAFGQWPALPLSRRAIHTDFAQYRDEELMNRTSHVLLLASLTSVNP